MNKTLLPLLVLSLALAGCAGTAERRQKSIEANISVEDADNATISPAPLYTDDSSGEKIKMGAIWSSLAPQSVSLILAFDADSIDVNASRATPDFTGLNIMFGNKKYIYATSYPTEIDIRTYRTASSDVGAANRNIVVVPYTVFKKMMASKDCRLKISSRTGDRNVRFSVERFPDNSVTAIFFLRIFMNNIGDI